jgi:hypothetical protein
MGDYGYDVEFAVMLLGVVFLCLCVAGVAEAIHDYRTSGRNRR